MGWNPAADVGEQWKLGRTRALLDLAGAPDRRMRCVLVAGTKGKGSTAASLAALLSSAGVRAGLYTQPHLQSYLERIRVDGEIIGSAAFADLARRWRGVVARMRRRHPGAGAPTTFEITTAMAIDHFAASGCAVAVLEVGLGGRLDATNAVEPELSIITTIGRGHTDILGTRLGDIAREKAGIVRRDRVALVAEQRPVVRRALAAACRAAGARCRTVSADGVPRLALRGAFQRQNAALAIAAARELGARPRAGILGRIRWPGRMEVPPRRRVLLDGAHDLPSAAALEREIRAERIAPVELVIGMFRDKEAARILRILLPLARRVWVTAPPGARALPAADLARVCRRLTGRKVEIREDVGAAIDAARADGRWVVVTGSLALVGRARDGLGLPVARRLWD